MKFDEIVKALRLCGETTECISERIGCPYCENTDDCKRLATYIHTRIAIPHNQNPHKYLLCVVPSANLYKIAIQIYI